MKMSRDRVAVLGCGPAGLLAAHAVRMAGCHPVIIGRKVKSRPGGAQFIDRPVSGLKTPLEKFYVRMMLEGEGDNYTRRLYEGHDIPVRSSWHNYVGKETVEAWGMTELYDQLWDDFSDEIIDLELYFEDLVSIDEEYENVVSTIPRWLLDPAGKPDPKLFPARKIWIVPDDPIASILSENTVCYNGTPLGANPATSHIYRFSNIRGQRFAESTQPVENGIPIVKPIAFCGEDVFPQWLKVGRYGAWSKMQLASHAYYHTMNWLIPA